MLLQYYNAVSSCRIDGGVLACPKNKIQNYVVSSMIGLVYFCLRNKPKVSCPRPPQRGGGSLLLVLVLVTQLLTAIITRYPCSGASWIGYQDIREEGKYRCYDADDVTYSNFAGGAPKNMVSKRE